MRDDEKECGNCLHSYTVCEQFHLRQKCRSPEYNSPDYTQEMLLEDWGRGYCRFWTPSKQRKEMTMKNNYSIAERNRIVEEHLSCIDKVIRRNTPLMRAAHLDHDDVYQDLAVRLILCVAGFDPDKGDLEQHIMSQLQSEMLSCTDSLRRYGLTQAPYDLRGAAVSLDALREDSGLTYDACAA